MQTLSDDIGGLSNLLPDQANRFESNLVQSTQKDNLFSTPSYNLSKSHHPPRAAASAHRSLTTGTASP